MESRYFRTRDGLRLHYISHPCAEANCTSYCILLHGFTNDAHVWDSLVSSLQGSHHVIALDQRGHGDSLGARVAILALESSPSPVASLTLIDAGPEVNPDAGDRLVNDVMQLPAFYADAQAYRDSLARIYVMGDTEALAHVAKFGLRISQGKLRTKTDPAFTPGIWHKNAEFRNLNKERGALSEQIWKALRSLEIPVHLVRGQASSILEPALALAMIEAFDGRGVLSVVPRAGHAVMLDNPVKSATVIAEFIHGVS